MYEPSQVMNKRKCGIWECADFCANLYSATTISILQAEVALRILQPPSLASLTCLPGDPAGISVCLTRESLLIGTIIP